MTFEQANENKDYDAFCLDWHICICDTCSHYSDCWIPRVDYDDPFGNSIDSCAFYEVYNGNGTI